MKFFEKLAILLLLIGMAGCGAPIRVQEMIPSAPGKEYRLVVTDVADFADFRDSRWRAFYRSGDERISGPIFALVAGGRVCPVPMLVWAAKPIGVPVTCDWRAPHSVNRPEPIFRS